MILPPSLKIDEATSAANSIINVVCAHGAEQRQLFLSEQMIGMIGGLLLLKSYIGM